MKAELKPRIYLENRPKLQELIPLATPTVINVDPADVCNFRCKFCPTGDIQLMRATPGRTIGLMDFNLFKKVVDDICEFDKPIKVLRLYKDGEPLLNPKFPEMVRYAKEKRCSELIDTTTNGSRLTPELSQRIVDAGLDRINISVYGVKSEQYSEFSRARVDFDRLVENIRYLYEHRGDMKMLVKINGDVISEADREKFLQTFGDITDYIYVEHVMSCWPEFKVEEHGIPVNTEVGIYGQPIKEVLVCPYIFYSFSINSNGAASACFLDWERRLGIGDAKTQSVKEIWEGAALLAHQKMMLMGERKRHPVCGNCGQMSHGLPDDIDAYAEKLLGKLN